ncbi:amidase [Natrarchaeobius chitinivorans]|uniref:Amidase n=1 Tax=Natrarchaeobius chitinivorans TaxID=1679083 RepID=A0A3N6LXF7_NATCH|nr:amidase [Natrarchaeobius chitinivorans]RQG95458.1 amidase [Natrarchaeobius chitinivorans]
MASDLCSSSAVELAEKIKTGELSSVDVVDAHLNRIYERNDTVNSFLTVMEDEARTAAREADRAVRDGKHLGPLHGVPVGIKDLYDVAGVPTSMGCKLYEDDVAEEDGVVAKRVKQAGGVIIGKTNTSQFGRGGNTRNELRDPCITPFDEERTAGGSSGGSCAATADGQVPIAHGSDGGGSIRIPASFCGVYGLKPSFGRIPMIKRPDAFAHHTPMLNIGPISRHVADAALMLDVMAGPHERDPFSLPAPATPYLDATTNSIDGLDIAVCRNFTNFPLREDVESVINDAVSDIDSKTGANVERIQLDFDYTHQEVLDIMYNCWNEVRRAASDENFRKEHTEEEHAAYRDVLQPHTQYNVKSGHETGAVEYKQTQNIRTEIYDTIADIFESYDLLISPVVSIPAFDKRIKEPDEIDGEPIPEHGWHYTAMFNYTGHPAASVPAGLTPEGLPVGLQLIGPRLADKTVIAASATIEDVRPWHDTYSI